MITFTLRGGRAALDRFYAAADIPKGPSFGLRFPLLCPFMYLAHYDQVTDADGRGALCKAGLDPELIRLSVGAAPAGPQVEALRAALNRCV